MKCKGVVLLVLSRVVGVSTSPGVVEPSDSVQFLQ